MCPLLLVKQWEQEIKKSVNIELNIIVVTTATELLELSYRDIIDAGLLF